MLFYTSSCLRVFFLATLVSVVGCSAPAVSGRSQVTSLSGPTMGTRYNIKCWSDKTTATDAELQTAVDELLTTINQQMSNYLAESELSRFNAAPAGEWFPVSPQTAFVTQQALHFYNITGGASDVTVGPLVKLWDFGPGRKPPIVPTQGPTAEQLATTLSQTGGEHLEVRTDPPALKKDIDALQVDLSSIAKGYAVDAVAELLQKRGYKNFMVEIGGEVRAGGARVDGDRWRIGVERPDPQQRAIHHVVELRDQSLATSGDYRNFRVTGGEKVSHIIDPKTGRPLPYRGWSVTLLTKTCLEADALATALLVMGEDDAYNWCVEHKVAALFLMRSDESIQERATPAFQKLSPLATKKP